MRKFYVAKFNSIVDISGTVGDFVYYKLNGVQVVRKKSGFNSDDFKTKQTYQKVRENSTEFGHCSKTGKMLRQAIAPYISENGDKYLYQKFAKVMTEIKDLDTTSERGKRRIENGLQTIDGRKILKNFRFGNIENTADIEHAENLMDHTVHFKTAVPKGEILFLTLQPDFQNYTCEIFLQKTDAVPQKKKYIFEPQNDNFFNIQLYFLVLKDGEDVKIAGFI